MGRGDGQKDRQAGAGGKGDSCRCSHLSSYSRGVSCLSEALPAVSTTSKSWISASSRSASWSWANLVRKRGGGARDVQDSKNVVSVCQLQDPSSSSVVWVDGVASVPVHDPVDLGLEVLDLLVGQGDLGKLRELPQVRSRERVAPLGDVVSLPRGPPGRLARFCVPGAERDHGAGPEGRHSGPLNPAPQHESP